MKTQTNFILTILLLFGTRFYDIYSTFIYIPDLKGETNVLVSQFGIGWFGVLLVQFIGLCFLTFSLFIYFFRKVETIPIPENQSLKNFISIFYFNNPKSIKKLFYKLPTNKNSLLYSMGAIGPKSLIIISLIVGTSTTFLVLNETYRNIYKSYHIATLLYFLMLTIIVIMTLNFFRIEQRLRVNTPANTT